MADEEQTTTPTESTAPAKADGGNKNWMLIGVVVFLALGGLFLYNQMTKTPAENLADEVEDTTEEVVDTAEDMVNEAEEAQENADEAREDALNQVKEGVENALEEKADTLKDIVETAQEAGGFTTLLAAAKVAGLDETLAQDGPFTILAPTDEAFKEIPAGTLAALLKDPEKLGEILKAHVISGKIMSDQIVDGMEEPTLQGGVASFTVNPDGTVEVNGAKVVKADVDASNGVIHVIDMVIIPVDGE